MERSGKEAVVQAITAKFDRMTSAVFLDFKGLDVATVSKLRDDFLATSLPFSEINLHWGILQDDRFIDYAKFDVCLWPESELLPGSP